MACELLLTGFEPFGHWTSNPSWDGLQAMLARYPELSASAAVATARLPVSYASARITLQQAVLQHQPRTLLSLGIHGGADSKGRSARGFYIETRAFNCDDARIPDNSGQSPAGQVIDPAHGPQHTLAATLDAELLHRALAGSGHEAHFSSDAGRYLCNHVFYCALQRAWTYEPGAGFTGPECVGFVHIPPLQANEVRDAGFRRAEDYVPALYALTQAILSASSSRRDDAGSHRTGGVLRQ